MIGVLIVDDRSVVRRGLEQLLGSHPEMSVVGTAENGEQAVLLAAELAPDVILMDLSMPVLDGVQATKQITAASPDISVVVLTSFSDQRRILDALAAGAAGYILKDADPDELINAVLAVAKGGSPLHPKAAGAAGRATRGDLGPAVECPRGGGPEGGGRGPAEQADRPPAGDHRAHRQGAPHPGLPAARGGRPDPGSAVGAGEPAGRGSLVAVRERWSDDQRY